MHLQLSYRSSVALKIGFTIIKNTTREPLEFDTHFTSIMSMDLQKIIQNVLDWQSTTGYFRYEGRYMTGYLDPRTQRSWSITKAPNVQLQLYKSMGLYPISTTSPGRVFLHSSPWIHRPRTRPDHSTENLRSTVKSLVASHLTAEHGRNWQTIAWSDHQDKADELYH